MRMRSAALVLALCVVAACGGDDGAGPGFPTESATSTVPASVPERVPSTLPPMSPLAPVSPHGPACEEVPGGRIAYDHQAIEGTEDPSWSIRVVGADGTDLGTVLDATAEGYLYAKQPAWSPDGTRLAVFLNSPEVGPTIAIIRCDGTVELTMSRLVWRTSSPFDTRIASPSFPTWSPDGSRIAFVSSEGLYVVDPANSDKPYEMRLDGLPVPGRASWSPDGTFLAVAVQSHSQVDIYLLSIDGQTVVRLTDDAAADYQPAWSPDGSTIAFRRGESDGRIWLMAADGSDQRQLTVDGAEAYQPAWSPDGTEIVYLSGDPGATWLRVVGVDGNGDRPLTPAGAPGQSEGWPSWTP